MKRNINPAAFKAHPVLATAITLLVFAFLLTAMPRPAAAQASQLSLADILIALRSKKASLPDRNKILAEAITTRGTTFTLTPEIEKELSVTGADKSLLESIRQRGQMLKVSATLPSTVDIKSSRTEAPKTEPVAQPPAPDFSFYEKRADESFSKGNFDGAIVDYTKAIEMNPAAASALFGRGVSYVNKNSFTLAIADYSKVLELNPQNVPALARRGEAYEKKGNAELAADDYKKALELDPANDIAKSGMERFKAEAAKTAVKTEPVLPPVVTAPVAVPEFVELGQLSDTRAIKMVKPLYAQMASRAGIGGQIVVDVELDTEGNVVKAKAVSGNQYLRQGCEDAARKSKFRPAMVGNTPAKGRGKIVYNFVPSR